MKSVFDNPEKLKNIVKRNISLSSCIKEFGMNANGGNMTTIKYYISKYNIDISHFLPFKECQKKFTGIKRKLRSLEEILVYGKLESTHGLKMRLIRNKLKEYKCERCNLTQWLEEKIPLEFHHIDGDRLNNVLENIALLCPNCHALTENYRSKNQKTNKIPIEQKRNTKKKIFITKSPLKEDLEKLLWTIPTTKIAEMYKVSDKAVEKWAKKYNLTKPSRGYWSKIKNNVPIKEK